MAQFEQDLHVRYDGRIATLGRIKSRSIGADALTLMALNVLTYAQLEGGVKELSNRTIKDVNSRKMAISLVSPALLKWRNVGDIAGLRSSLSYDNFADQYPLATEMARTAEIRTINTQFEYNQMNWEAISSVYTGFRLSDNYVKVRQSEVDSLVRSRNDAAHHGVLPSTILGLLEKQVRANVGLVELILTDLTLQLLTFFSGRLHLR